MLMMEMQITFFEKCEFSEAVFAASDFFHLSSTGTNDFSPLREDCIH